MPTFSPNGRAAAILEALTEGDAGFVKIGRIIGSDTNRKAEGELFHTINAMLRTGIIGGRKERYFLRPEGRRVLDKLRDGKPVTINETESARVFG